jgi:hypothetical protein
MAALAEQNLITHAPFNEGGSPETRPPEIKPRVSPSLALSEVSQLHVSFAPCEADTLTLWHKPLLAIATDETVPLISHTYGQPQTTWAKGQILMVTTYDQAVILRATGKPLLWIGEGTAPEGLVAYDPASDVPIHEQARPAAPDPTHFTSYRALLEHVAPTPQLALGARK